MAGFTLCESYLVACICSMYTPMSVLLSTVATLMATLGLTFYAVTTKTDFTAIFSYVKGNTIINTAWLSSLIWMVLGVTMINLFFLRSPAV